MQGSVTSGLDPRAFLSLNVVGVRYKGQELQELEGTVGFHASGIQARAVVLKYTSSLPFLCTHVASNDDIYWYSDFHSVALYMPLERGNILSTPMTQAWS